jgi:hypothetical protein
MALCHGDACRPEFGIHALGEQLLRQRRAESAPRHAGDEGVLLPASRTGIFLSDQSLRFLPLMARFGRGFGGEIERASRAITLPAG